MPRLRVCHYCGQYLRQCGRGSLDLLRNADEAQEAEADAREQHEVDDPDEIDRLSHFPFLLGGLILVVLIVIGIAAGLAYAWADRRISVPPRTERALALSLATVVVTVVVAAPVTFFAAADRPGHLLQEKWRSFKTLPTHESGSSHLTSLGSNRYDFWRVDVRDARRHPLAGIGARGGSAHRSCGCGRRSGTRRRARPSRPRCTTRRW